MTILSAMVSFFLDPSPCGSPCNNYTYFSMVAQSHKRACHELKVESRSGNQVHRLIGVGFRRIAVFLF